MATGDRAGAVIDRLTSLLANSDAYVRCAAAEALGNIPLGDRAGAVIDKLTALLGDPEWKVPAAAAEALGKIPLGDRAGAVIDKFTSLLGDPEQNVRAAAAEALGKIPLGDRAGAVIDKFTSLLGDPEQNVRAAAAEALGKIPLGDRAGAVIEKLTPLLGDPGWAVRAAAAEALGKIPLGDRAGAVIDKFTSLLGDPEQNVRAAAAEALGKIPPGDRAGDEIEKLTPLLRESKVIVIDKLTPLLADKDQDVASAAAEALGKITTTARASGVIDKVVSLLTEGDYNVRSAATEVLASLATGARAGAVMDKLVPMLGDSRDGVRSAAAQALAKMATGDGANSAIDKLTPLLAEKNERVRSAAAEALGNIPLGDRAVAVIDKLTPGLGDPEWKVRAAAAEALGKIPLGDRAGAVIDKFTSLLGDPEWEVRAAAAEALGKVPLGDRAGAVIDKLTPLLRDLEVQSAAAEALGKIPLGDRAGAVIDKLTPLLAEMNETARSAAEVALGNMPLGDRADAVIERLTPVFGGSRFHDHHFECWSLNEGCSSFREQIVVMKAISQIGPAGVGAEAAIVRFINSDREENADQWRATAHILTGADQKHEDSELLLAWIGRPHALPLATVADKPAAAHKVLELLTNRWAALSKEPRAREEAENAAMAAIEAACRTPAETSNFADLARASLAWLQDLPTEGPVRRCWTPAQRATVETLLADFKESHSTHERALEAHLKSEGLAPVGLWLSGSLALWTLFWAAFLVAFPWSRTVQAIFFWNPRARQFFSAGFVPLLLLILPPLRRRLLEPFRDDLVAQARLEELPKLGYFADGRARMNGGEPAPLSQLRSHLGGVVVLQADSGFGKTSFLREIAARSKRPVAFLHARDCADGVDVAISRIIHDVQETGFVRSLIYTRALTVIVDGLNEVSADTREKVGGFARDMSKGDVIVATQPIEWRLPLNSREVELLPLNRSEATAFLQCRPVGEDAN